MAGIPNSSFVGYLSPLVAFNYCVSPYDDPFFFSPDNIASPMATFYLVWLHLTCLPSTPKKVGRLTSIYKKSNRLFFMMYFFSGLLILLFIIVSSNFL